MFPTERVTDIVVSNAVLVLKALIQNQLLIGSSAAASPQSPFTIIALLARRIDDIKHPQARACVLWLVGQYSAASGSSTVIEGVADWAPDVLRKFAKSFNAEVCLPPRFFDRSRTPSLGAFGQASSSHARCQTFSAVSNGPEAESTLSPRTVSRKV